MINAEIDVRARKLIAQQLPDLEKLQQLWTSVECIAANTAGDEAKQPTVSAKQLNEYHQELAAKIHELLHTPYCTELYLVILPALIAAKSVESD